MHLRPVLCVFLAVAASASWSAVVHASPTPGTVLWAAEFEALSAGWQDLAVGPHGNRVYLTGQSGYDFVTAAYRISDGERLWVRRFDSRFHRNDEPLLIAASPDGSKVFVSGTSKGLTRTRDIVTIAYSSSTGNVLWRKRIASGGEAHAQPVKLSSGPDGRKVFVAGRVGDPPVAETVAYESGGGRQLWRVDLGQTAYEAMDLAPAPDGDAVYFAGTLDAGQETAASLVALDARNGGELWRRDLTSLTNGDAVAVSRSGQRVFLVGRRYDARNDGWQLVTAAFASTTGEGLWRACAFGDAGDILTSVGSAATGGGAVVVFDSYENEAGDGSAVAFAYSGAGGAERWSHHLGTYAGDLTLSPDARSLYVTTLPSLSSLTRVSAFRTQSGSFLWSRRFVDPRGGFARGWSLGAAAGGVFLSGARWDDAGDVDGLIRGYGA